MTKKIVLKRRILREIWIDTKNFVYLQKKLEYDLYNNIFSVVFNMVKLFSLVNYKFL